MTGSRLKPSARRVLHRLQQGPATTAQLCQPDVGGVRFGARLLELRHAGYTITERRLHGPVSGSRYQLLTGPDAERAA